MMSEGVHREMASAAREFARSKTWCGVLQQSYRTYETGSAAIDFATSGLRCPKMQRGAEGDLRDLWPRC